MRAVVQRVKKGKVTIGNEVVGEIGHGLVVLLGVAREDQEEDLEYLVSKIVNLRIFNDSEGKMNLSLKDVAGEMLVVSQFTLYGDCRKGRRPSFINAAQPEKANDLYEDFVRRIQGEGIKVATGRFQEEMLVEIHNDGPVTIIVDSQHQF
ncbi:MAG: D-tyrosyl-tRNA(Tyr) deacylase [Clostridia bacterium]|jgi:D-tyrosyl-tRNA(Tyr) deacylase|nr:D-tyrosyl-tRNA(Tyr) deacylase [Clostridia bacterium]